MRTSGRWRWEPVHGINVSGRHAQAVSAPGHPAGSGGVQSTLPVVLISAEVME